MRKTKIGQICKISSGGTPSRKNAEYYKNGSIKWIKTGDLKSKYLYEATEYITVDAVANSSAKLFPPDTVLIAMYGATIGLCSILKVEAATNQACAALLPSEHFIPEYMYYYISYKKHDIVAKGVGGAQPNISAKILKDYEIPLPPLEIQKKIVEVLDKAQGLIDARKKQIKLMDDLIQSVFYEMFGDPVTNPKKINQLPLGELCNLRAGKFIKAAQISDLYEEKLYPCYGGNGLRGYVEEYTYDGSYPLIGRQGALCGNLQFAEGKFYATEHAIVAQPKADLDITWLYIMLREMDLNRLATGAAQPGLNVSTLMPLEVIYPKISLQTEFAKKFKEIEFQKAFMKKSLIDIENNYYGLLQKAFSGKLF